MSNVLALDLYFARIGYQGPRAPTLAVLSRRYIDRVLVYTGGNKTRAADVLGIDRRTLNRMFARERAAVRR